MTPGPYASGQQITVNVGANPTLSTAGQTGAGAPAPTGLYYFEECEDPGGITANLPTSFSGCEAGTLDTESGNTTTGAVEANSDFTVYDLPDAKVSPGGPTMTAAPGKCDVAPDYCVIGIFAANPNSGNPGFPRPHLFSAPFQTTVGDGLDQGDNPGDGTAAAVTPTSPTNSSLVANVTTVAADGVNTAQITVTLKDTTNHPVTGGKSVTLSQGSGHSTIEVNGTAGSTATTDGNGQAVFVVSDTTAETVTYTLTDTTDTVTVAQTAQIVFVAPLGSASNSSISALNTSVPQSGSTTVTVTLRDQGASPQPISGKVIALTQGSGSSSITPASTGSATTNAQGQATFTVSDTTAETVTYSATDTTDGVALAGQSVSVTFGTLTVSAAQSKVSTTTPIVATAASGVTQTNGTVIVTLLDGTSPVAGKTVKLSASSPTATITPSSQTTGVAGEAAFSVSDTTAEIVTFSAVDSSDSNLAITATAQVTFELPSASPSESTVTVSPSTVAADGTTSAALTVTIEDQFGNPLAGKTVTMAATVAGTSNPSATVRVDPSGVSGSVVQTATNSSGVITFDTNDTAAESLTYTATDTTDSITVAQTATVTFTAGAPQVSDSTVRANPAAVPANGSTASTVTVTVEDHNQNPVPGITITLIALNGSSVIEPASVVTNTSGQAAFKVTDATSEVVRYRVTDTTDNLPFVGEEVQVTFGTPPPTSPAVADSDVVASSTMVPADGHSSATVEVILNDDNGLPLSGKSVTLVPSSVNAIVSPAKVSTDSNGVANFAVTDHTPESVTLTAADISDNFPLNGLSVTISFTPAATSPTVSANAGHLNQPLVGIASSPDGGGYWLVASDGGVFSEGDAVFYGSAGAIHLNEPIVGIAPTPDGKGYWLVASDGGVFNYGDAGFYGSAGAIHLNEPIVGIAPTPDGKGYWLVASDGGVFNYGDAGFFGSAGAIHLNRPVVSLAATSDGGGYWLVATDGGIFNYGDAAFDGSAGATPLNKPVVDMAATPDGGGYWLVASDGGIFNYGDAAFDGSTGALQLNEPVVGMAATPNGKGYWLAASDGGIFNYGNAAFYGSMAG